MFNSKNSSTPQPTSAGALAENFLAENYSTDDYLADGYLAPESAQAIKSSSTYYEEAQALNIPVPPVAGEPNWGPLYSQTFDLTDPGTLDTRKKVLVHTGKQSWKRFLGNLLYGFVQYGSTSLLPITAGYLLDQLIIHGLSKALWLPTLYLLLNILVASTLYGFMQMITLITSERACFDDIDRTASRSVTNGHAISQEISSGDVVQTVETDAYNLAMFYESSAHTLSALLVALGVCWYMFAINIPMGLAVLLSIPLFSGISSLISKPLHKRIDARRTESGTLTTVANDAVMGLRILRGLGAESRYLARYEKQSERLRDTGIAMATLNSLSAVMRQASPAIVTAIILGIGSAEIYAGRLEPGQLVAFFGLTGIINTFMMRLSWLIIIGPKAWVSARKIAALNAVPRKLNDNADLEAPSEPYGELADPISGAQAPAGKLTALVCAEPDRSAQVAKRFARLDEHTPATLNGQPLTEMPLKWVRTNLLYSHGEAGLFAGTLREGLLGRKARAAKPLSPGELLAWNTLQNRLDDNQFKLQDQQRKDLDDKLLGALKAAACADVMGSLQLGLDGLITEKGRNLSGGQRQRVSLARALAQQSPNLILVEPTSALDANTENQVAEDLKAHRNGKTTIIATASPLVLHHTDHVIFLGPDGQVQDTGTHHELFQRNSAYRALTGRGNA
ncbi:hypothetical protein BSR29_00345 [Boudabousia liubingyangii]|uniref:ABC transporter ATP-binding protein n=1 Tax=Boudabousia liubingyangii TaxID=1921764 RepID=A0A1Q5PPH5_9ACTO|nr:ABC transporter ATP-binding protein [Boudabousia liubingyangii]OKL49454.1 hypothetical protein BSR29_00345 [Boudabousia liubingyangii]